MSMAAQGSNRRLAHPGDAGQQIDLSRPSPQLQSESATGLGFLTMSIAHELNQPLSGILTNASACLRMLDADAPNVHGALETVRRTIRDVRRCSDIITRLRALAAGGQPVCGSVDLNAAAQDVLGETESELRACRAIARLELSRGLPTVEGDCVQLRQVILNLVRNAVESMQTVRDRPRALTLRTETDDNDRVRLSVTDAGAGIAADAQHRLFEAFYTTKPGGMGIGLAISRCIIERHGGRLWAAANDGPGTTFSFAIPHLAHMPSTSCRSAA